MNISECSISLEGDEVVIRNKENTIMLKSTKSFVITAIMATGEVQKFKNNFPGTFEEIVSMLKQQPNMEPNVAVKTLRRTGYGDLITCRKMFDNIRTALNNNTIL